MMRFEITDNGKPVHGSVKWLLIFSIALSAPWLVLAALVFGASVKIDF
jgi:hypothetical protein